MILSDGRDRAILTALGTIGDVTESDVPDRLLSAARHLHIGSWFLQAGIRPGAQTLLARARGDQRGLLAVLQEMDSSDPDPPGEVGLSASILRESVADVLLALGRAGEALAAYQAVVRDHPGRAHSMLGAARAAKRAGKPEVARSWYAKLAEQWSEADEGTDGLAEVRAAAR